MSAPVKVESIVISAGESQVLLSIEEAKELQKQLNDLFGVEKEIQHVPYTSTKPEPWQPTWMLSPEG